MTRYIILAAALLLVSLPASAFDCFPSNYTPTPATGTATRTVTTPAGSADAWWCLLPATSSTPPDKVLYAPQIFVVLNKYRSATLFLDSLSRIIAASDPFAATQNEIKAATIKPAPGSQDEYEFNLLAYRACQALATPPYTAPIDPLPADWCGIAPVAPVEVWWVAKAPTNANPPGTRPAYHYQGGVMVAAQQRVAEYTLCQPEVARLVLDKVSWCSYSGGVLWAVAAKKP